MKTTFPEQNPEQGRRIIICGGHLTPALAVLEILQKENWQILFLGRGYMTEKEKRPSVESQIIPARGIGFASISAGRIQRKLSLQTFPALLKIPFGFFQALFWVIKFKPDLVLSFGSYVAVPVALAAWLVHIPIVTHIQSVHPDLSNRLIGMLADKICLSWEDSQKYFSPQKVIITGNPLRGTVTKFLNHSQVIPDWLSQLKSESPLIYFSGGSLGSTSLNLIVKDVLPLLKKYCFLHQCGQLDYSEFLKLRQNLPEELRQRYLVKDWFNDEEVGAIFSVADLFVGRSGANTVAEVAAFGLPALFIPLPWGGKDEQLQNAQKLQTVGTAQILLQKNLTPQNLISAVENIFSRYADFHSRRFDSQSLFKPQSANLIVQTLKKAHAHRQKNL